MNLDEIWDTPGYFYALGYFLGTVSVLWFEEARPGVWRKPLSCAALLVFLIPFSIITKGTWGVVFVLSMVAMVLAMLHCVNYNIDDPALAVFTGLKGFIYGEFAASLCWQIYYALAIRCQALQRWPCQLGIMLAGFAVMAVVYFFMERSLHRERTSLNLMPRDLIVETVIVVSVYVVSNLGYVDSSTLFSGSFARDIFAIRTLVDLSGVAMIYALQRQLIEVQTRFENDTLHSIMQMQYQSYQLSQESIDMVNQKYHDLKHQIALLKSQAAPGRAEDNLNRLEKDIKKYEARNQTGNPVLDAVLTNKSLYCQNHNIELKVIADGRPLSMMEDMEIAALFGNMLDNAIESCERIPDRQKRLVRLYVADDKGFLRVRIENYCEERIRFVNGMPLTTKRDKRYHGFGMKSMQRTVEKYGGSMVASQQDNWFVLKILIPIAR